MAAYHTKALQAICKTTATAAALFNYNKSKCKKLSRESPDMKLKHRNANYKHKLLIYSCCLAYECVIQSGFSRERHTTCFNLRLESSEIPSLLCICKL